MTRQPGKKFQNADVLRMFPTFVWKAELWPEVYTPINDSILRSLGEIGTPLTDLMPPCGHCGKANRMGSRCCIYCGNRLR